MTMRGRILITGGTGTLGKAIITKAFQEHWPVEFTVYSRSELSQALMRAKFPSVNYVLGDVRDYDRLAAAVAGHDFVIHAAAIKRIPEAEVQPQECFDVNVRGAENVIRACINGGVIRCVGISTDKACRATTAYGASKLMLEKLFAAAPEKPCIFTTVRYGNVVASRGSVIPIWRAQAQQGRALTITSDKMTRFWMSPFQAVDLVIEGFDQPHGTVTVHKMHALPIVTMAKYVAPGAEIQVVGLRSEEKIHEDLIHPNERVIESPEYFQVGKVGTIGKSYTSDIAPILTESEFQQMILEAELLE